MRHLPDVHHPSPPTYPEFPTETATTRAGTVGDDVLRVHELTDTADPRPKCGAGEGEPVDEWLRTVNCPDCAG